MRISLPSDPRSRFLESQELVNLVISINHLVSHDDLNISNVIVPILKSPLGSESH